MVRTTPTYECVPLFDQGSNQFANWCLAGIRSGALRVMNVVEEWLGDAFRSRNQIEVRSSEQWFADRPHERFTFRYWFKTDP